MIPPGPWHSSSSTPTNNLAASCSPGSLTRARRKLNCTSSPSTRHPWVAWLASAGATGHPQSRRTKKAQQRQPLPTAPATPLMCCPALIEASRLRDCNTRSRACGLHNSVEPESGKKTSSSNTQGIATQSHDASNANLQDATETRARPPSLRNLPQTRAALTQLRSVLIPASVEKLIAAHPGNDAAVVFVPHKALHLVPFASLLDKHGSPLIAQCAVSCAP
eukprot:m.473894 g.473894  ORF g.473894 m.473894 type:complete len:221 (-) comp20389_c0_seq2:182-844(-)